MEKKNAAKKPQIKVGKYKISVLAKIYIHVHWINNFVSFMSLQKQSIPLTCPQIIIRSVL